MILFLLAYLGGVLTIISPCILPVLPFVFARSDRPFVSSGLPMLTGMAATFAVVATLAAVGGGWAVQANEYGRYVALALLAVFGITLLFPALSDMLTRPVVALGSRLSETAERRAGTSGSSVLPSLLLGVATGLLWVPCAGPVLGLILTGAALQGANVQTSLLLVAYAAGAATSLALRAGHWRPGLCCNETVARRRRMDKARPGRRGTCGRPGHRAGPRYEISHPGFARQHRPSRTGSGGQAPSRPVCPAFYRGKPHRYDGQSSGSDGEPTGTTSSTIGWRRARSDDR